MEFKLKSVKTIIYKTIRDLGLGDKEIAWQDYIEWAIEALQLIDAYTQYIEKHKVELKVENNFALLPSDFYTALSNPGLAYKIQGNSLLTDTPNGTIKFNYLAFPLDDEGFLLVPDHISYDEAIKWRIATMLSIRGELLNPNIDLKYCENKWNFYCTQAKGVSNSLNADAIERFAKNRLRLKPDHNQYKTNFYRVENPINRNQ
jgi:hypothetical protein